MKPKKNEIYNLIGENNLDLSKRPLSNCLSYVDGIEFFSTERRKSSIQIEEYQKGLLITLNLDSFGFRNELYPLPFINIKEIVFSQSVSNILCKIHIPEKIITFELQKKSLKKVYDFFINCEMSPTISIEFENKIENNEKQDLSKGKDSSMTLAGILLFAILIFVNFSSEIQEMIYLENALYLYIFIYFIIRVLVTVWVESTARKKNRNSTIWALFAFIVPSLVLIILGQLNRRK